MGVLLGMQAAVCTIQTFCIRAIRKEEVSINILRMSVLNCERSGTRNQELGTCCKLVRFCTLWRMELPSQF